MHIESTAKESWICWQGDPEDGIAEPALLIEKYYDSIRITQGNDSIDISIGSVDDLCKHLRKIIK